MKKDFNGGCFLISLEEYSKLTDGVEAALDKADRFAAENDTRMSHEEV